MNNEILNLKPELIWKYFNEITKIPRASKKEEHIIKYLVEFGKQNNFETIVDAIGNVVIKKNATHGMENRKTVILQSHMDMVCEKNSDIVFDFEKDAIQTKIEGEWLKAIGTTLGADCGIGVATTLAVLTSKDISHPKIEALFTVDEETGLTGAFGLQPNFLEGSILLNLDSEDEGEMFIGCAGGKGTVAEITTKTTTIENKSALKINISGLNGGHSGDDINKGYANANKILATILKMAITEFNANLNFIDGGNLRNAIAREAYAIVLVEKEHISELVKSVNNFAEIFKNTFSKTEHNIKITTEEVKTNNLIINNTDFKNIVEALLACPHGVLAWSKDIENFVETSTNLASIKMDTNKIVFTTSQRSSNVEYLNGACNMVAAVFNIINCKVTHSDGYPGWQPNPNSEILEIAKKAYVKLFAKEPKVLAIHAGLECGLIGEKYPKMDMISFGPTIKAVHSPDEKILIKTVLLFWNHLIEILNNIPEK